MKLVSARTYVPTFSNKLYEPGKNAKYPENYHPRIAKQNYGLLYGRAIIQRQLQYH